MASRLLRFAFVAYVLATVMHIAIVVHDEPFAFDAWNMVSDTHGEPFSPGRFVAYVGDQYTHSNPRFGQSFSYLAYKLEWFAVIATPLAYLGLALAMFVLGTGRLPRRGRDLALGSLAIGLPWLVISHLGMIVFCRAYATNYLYGAAIQLGFLAVLRLRPDGRASVPACIAYAIAGVIAGMCNEHTGPTLVLVMFGFAIYRHFGTAGFRRAGQVLARAVIPGARFVQSFEPGPPAIAPAPTLAWSGAVGVLVGFAAIFFAPGQGERYDGLATQVSFVGRLISRGISGNLDIVADYVLAAAPVLGLVVIVLIVARAERRDARLGFLGLALLAGLLCAATLFVSPKLGPRFYLASCAALLAAFLGVADALLDSPRRLAPFVLLAIVASAYAAAHTIPLYGRLAEESEDRLAALARAPRDTMFTADSFEQVDPSWWFLGDDFRDGKKRDLVATYIGLHGVIFRAVDLEAPLGVSDVRLTPRYELTPPSCLADHGGFELPAFRGLDVASIHEAMRAGVDALLGRIGGSGRLDRLDLEVEFLGQPPVLPRPRLLVGRWRPTGFEGYVATVKREGHGTTRDVILPPALKTQDAEIILYQVGGEARHVGNARDAELHYTPWKRGGYWLLACRPDECFVIAASRQL